MGVFFQNACSSLRRCGLTQQIVESFLLQRCFRQTIAVVPLRRLKCVSSRFVEFQQDFETDYIGSKTYFEFLDTKRKSFRW